MTSTHSIQAMSTVTQVLIYGGIAGVTIPLGALLNQHLGIRSAWIASEVRHGILAFGAGALLAAVALVLVPRGGSSLSLPILAVAFFGGGFAFTWLDLVLSRHRSTLSQVVAMLTDFLPECLALGALFLTDLAEAKLLALLIAMQNLPEAFSACSEMENDKSAKSSRVMLLFALLAPLATYTGLRFLGDSPEVIALIMTFAGGGILYLMFQEIAPKVVLKQTWLPPMGALAGFFIGVLGTVLFA